MRSVVEDQTTKARIRDAAIACIAEVGPAATTVRKVAERAEVSPGLVIHHYGTMGELRAVCDHHVAASIRHAKESAIADGVELDVLAALRSSDMGPLMGYLAAVLTDDSPAVAALVDELVDDAVAYMERGVEQGMLQPSEDPKARATVLVLWSLGGLVLHRHLERILGVDLTDPDLAASPAIARYALPAYEILGRGIFTDSFITHVRSAFAAIDAAEPVSEGTP